MLIMGFNWYVKWNAIAFLKFSTLITYNHKTCGKVVCVLGEISGEEIKHFFAEHHKKLHKNGNI